MTNLNGARAALRGNPSFVWRAGQERRLQMILDWAPARLQRALVNGCGVGMYLRALQGSVPEVHGMDIEGEHLRAAAENVPGAPLNLSQGEQLPYPDGCFDLILSHEVLEHVQDDRRVAAEIVRTLRVGGRAIIFVPNRFYPFETHGHFWRNVYYFGNTPLINYLPNLLRNQLAPHVRVYTRFGLLNLFVGLPVLVRRHTQIFPGYDSIAARQPVIGRWLKSLTYALEQTPLTAFGISHFLVLEKVESAAAPSGGGAMGYDLGRYWVGARMLSAGRGRRIVSVMNSQYMTIRMGNRVDRHGSRVRLSPVRVGLLAWRR